MMISDRMDFLTGKKVLCLSPHHDDLLYSAALLVQLLLKQNCDLTNMCMFTQSCWTARGIGDINRISALRLQEEKAASMLYGFQTISLNMPDSSVRGLDETEELIAPMDQKMIEICDDKIRSFLNSQLFDVILMPLAAGGHIDHRYARLIGEKQTQISVRLYYEDMPYLTNTEQVYNYLPKDAEPIVMKGFLEDKRRGFDCYPSQSEIKNWKRIEQYSQQLVLDECAERIWFCGKKKEE